MTKLPLHYFDDSEVTTTVGDLVDALSKLDRNAFVFGRGFDGVGNIIEIEVEDARSVILNSFDDMFDYGYIDNKYTATLKAEYINRIKQDA